MPAVGQQPERFNRKWLESNALSNTMAIAGKELKEVERLPSRTGAKARLVEKGKKAPAPDESRFRGTRFQEGKPATKDQPASPPGGPESARGLGRRPQTGRGSYDEGLEQHDAQGMVPQNGPRRSRRRFATMADGSASTISVGEPWGDRAGAEIDLRAAETEFGGAQDVDGLKAYAGGLAGPAIDAGLPAGLASLDVQLPMRGVVYRFTTPGGDVKITARAVPSRLINRLIQAGLILAVVLVVLGAVRLRRRLGFHWLAGRTGSWCLLLVGLLSLCVFPVIGLAAIVAGIVVKIHRIGSGDFTPPTPGLQTEPLTPEVVAE